MKVVIKMKTNLLSGFTMIEILIAMVILSVGVLGLAGLQGASIKSSNTAYMRRQPVKFMTLLNACALTLKDLIS